MYVTLCLLGNFCMLFRPLLIFFFKIIFFRKKKFRNNIRVAKSLGPDQAQRLVRPDLTLDCLQRLLAADTSRLGLSRVNSDSNLV